MIGPFRGGRTKAAAGVPGQPNVFYIGAVNGGVWKTTDFGRTWVPVFDDQPTGSIGAISVAPSDPKVIYVGSGEGLQRPDLSTGDGIYKSVDAGRTWRHLGLRDGQQIPQIAIDPRDPNRLFVAVLGHPYGPNDERGVFRSTDGGETFQKVLYKDENTGAVDVVLDPKNPDVLYAVLWQARQAPWENGGFSGPGSGLFKSTDGGNSWNQLTKGLPTFDADGLGRMGVTVAPSDPNRLYATVATRTGGWLYRSDDAGESWRRASEDRRIAGRPDDFAEVKVHPNNPDIVFTANVVTWKSIDGAKTFTAIRGAPGGDDYHRIWINPDNPEIFLIASDQGAIITVNGGETFSSWYNQPTAQFYHVTTDNAFPYRVCGGQQESGSACVASRGDDGQITFREFHPVAVEEYGYVAADPLDPDVVYGGKLTRYDRRTAQVQNIAPKVFRSADYRALRTAPVVFSPLDPKTLYFATNTLWKTSNGGHSWAAISPDLTRRDSVVSPTIGIYGTTEQAKARHPGVIYAVAPSPKAKGVIWAGSDDGLIHVTMNAGRSWKNVTPAELVPWSKVSVIDASAHDSLTAYAAVNTLRLSDLTPHIYRTRDGGKTWAPITNGLPNGATVNAVRADPKRAGLLFAGSETAVYYSIDDGEHWQSLRLNMPATSIRDLVVKDDDLVVGTHGRGFWILDDITPLRQVTAATAGEAVTLFRPQLATRARWTQWPDTPLPQEEPAGKNPPEGASISYYLKEQVSSPMTLEILDRSGAMIRRYSSDDPPRPPIEGRNIPDYWIKPPQVLSTGPGMHRFYWDMRTPPPAVLEFSYPISGIYGATPQVPLGVLALPGSYTVRLMAGGATRTAPLTVRLDPRVKAGPAALQEQFGRSMRLYQALREDFDALTAVRAVRRELEDRRGRARGALTGALDSLGRKLTDLEGGAGGFGVPAARGRSVSGLARLNGDLAALFDVLQDVDAAPTTQATDAIRERLAALASTLAEWNQVRTADLSRVNAELRQAGFEPIGANR
ncbi:MAG: glycoside hydrolase [Gemmatimonadota bacterium]